MPSTMQAEWLNENALRAYPFAENSTRRPDSVSGGLLGEEYAIPNYVLVDAILVLPYMQNVPTLYVSSITLAGGIVTAVVSASDGSGIVGSVSASTSSPINTTVRFSGSGQYDGAVGALVFGDLARFESSFPDGVFTFQPEQTALESRCVRPSAVCVSGIRATDSYDSYSTRTLRGDVALVAGENIKLTYMPGVNGIRIDAEDNDDYSTKCDCDGSWSEVRTINGISIADVVIEGGDCISVETSGGRIKISDTCAKPCCGCEELNFLNSKSNELITAVSRLSSFVDNLNSRMDDLKESFLDSERSPIHNM